MYKIGQHHVQKADKKKTQSTHTHHIKVLSFILAMKSYCTGTQAKRANVQPFAIGQIGCAKQIQRNHNNHTHKYIQIQM